MNVLIADDELRLRKVVALFLKKQGHEVVEASSGEQALSLLKPDIDVIILDVRMAGISGVETAREIRKQHTYDKTPIILLTANIASEDRQEGMAAGASAYITKPFSPKDLQEKIMELTSGVPPR